MAGLLDPFVKQLGDGSDPLACAASLQLLADLLQTAQSNPAMGATLARLSQPAIVQAMQSSDTSVQCQALKVQPACQIFATHPLCRPCNPLTPASNPRPSRYSTLIRSSHSTRLNFKVSVIPYRTCCSSRMVRQPREGSTQCQALQERRASCRSNAHAPSSVLVSSSALQLGMTQAKLHTRI